MMTPDQRAQLIDTLFAEASREFPQATAGQLFRVVQMRLWTIHGQQVSGTEVARALVAKAGFPA